MQLQLMLGALRFNKLNKRAQFRFDLIDLNELGNSQQT